MKPLKPPDTFFVEAARGWLELGNAVEAQSELDKVGAKHREHPDVLEAMWQIAARHKEWDRSLELAAKVIKSEPKRVQGYIHMAYALHELGRTQEAWDFLFPVAGEFAADTTIKYNLACYATQLGRLWEAEQWLKLAFTVGNEKELRAMALEDRDLKPLWEKIVDM